MSKTRGARRVRSVLVPGIAALAGLALTGCSALNPGVAAQVGDETITLAEVDEVSADFCEAVAPQLEGQAETVPNSFFRGGIAGTLALRSVADQIAEDYGVSADSEEYLAQLTEIRRGVATLPEDIRDSVVEVDTTPLYVEEIQAAVGEELLGSGEREELVAAGQEAFATWTAENDVEFDPSLNTVMRNGTVESQDLAVSFAVSEVARGGLEQQPSAVLARRTPQSQRCGR